jgi:hypothetical protein
MKTGVLTARAVTQHLGHGYVRTYPFMTQRNEAFPVSLQKSLPIITSIVIILIVAALRERSRTLAAILSTMPINMVLGLWIISGSANATPETTVNFVRSLLVGMGPTLIWLVVLYLALRAGWGTLVSVVTGYSVWGLLIAGAFWFGIWSVNR